jgi:PleD family two-component response regulator
MKPVLERVRAAVAGKPFATTQDQPLAITVSIGCVELEPSDTTAQLIERASARLLVAKRDGRNRVCRSRCVRSRRQARGRRGGYPPQQPS